MSGFQTQEAIDSTQNILRVTCALIFENGKLLATQRGSDKANGGLWEFPGGKKEGSETDEACILREIREELSVEIEIQSKLLSVFHEIPGGKMLELIPFICRIISGEIQLNEHQNFQWCSKQTIASLDWSDADLLIMKELEGIPFETIH